MTAVMFILHLSTVLSLMSGQIKEWETSWLTNRLQAPSDQDEEKVKNIKKSFNIAKNPKTIWKEERKKNTKET